MNAWRSFAIREPQSCGRYSTKYTAIISLEAEAAFHDLTLCRTGTANETLVYHARIASNVLLSTQLNKKATILVMVANVENGEIIPYR